MRQAVHHFRTNGLEVKECPIESFQGMTECGLAQFFTIEDIPLILRDPEDPKKMKSVYWEIMKSIVGKSDFSFAGLFFNFLYNTNGLISKKNIPDLVKQGQDFRQELLVSDNIRISKSHWC